MTMRCFNFLGAISALKSARNSMPIWPVLVLLFVGLSSALAEEPDAKYLRIYNTIEKADSLAKSGKTDQAKSKYQEALTALRDLKQINPAWKAKAVAYRLGYVEEKLIELSKPTAAPGGGVVEETASGDKPGSGALPTDAQVTVLSAGAEPRQVLRLHPKSGDRQTLVMTIKTAMDMQIGDTPGQAMKMPAMTMTMDVTVKDVSANGDITFETVMGDTSVSDEPGVLPQVAEAMKTALGGTKGLSSTGMMSNRGLSKTNEVKLPAGAAPQLRQSLDQLKESLASAAVPLPGEAIGPGGKWEVKQKLKSQGMTIDQTGTYELVSVEGDQLTVRSDLVQQAANQKIQNPAMPAMKVDVTKMTGSARGDSKLDLTQLLPKLATIEARSEVSMGMNIGGQKQAMTMKSEMNIRLESK
jgi:Family of unknown function (DUF6263)